MTRPIYETDQSREAEARIAKTFAAFKSLHLVKLKFAYAVDYMLMGDTPKAFMEVKERHYDMDTLDRWGGFMLSLHKWSIGNQYAKDAGIHFVVVVKTTDGIWYHVSKGEIDGVSYGGRTDRNDPDDMEPVILLKKNRFTPLTGVFPHG